ncbi:MAG: NAD+ synthase [Candidatus Hodarchaeota archaeon]
MESSEESLILGIAQVNPTVGGITNNCKIIQDKIAMAQQKKVDLIIFPEMVVPGYPPQDLLFIKEFIKRNIDSIHEIAETTENIAAIVGFVDRNLATDNLFNAAAFINDGKIHTIHHKSLLPTYDIFDETRYFQPAKQRQIASFSKGDFGILICEDLWDSTYDVKVSQELVEKGAQFLITINASPFYLGKPKEREKLLCNKARVLNVPIVYVNMVGGQDEIVFDGRSMIVDKTGQIIFRCTPFKECLDTYELAFQTRESIPVQIKERTKEQEVIDALTLNLRDYDQKLGCFNKLMVGLSGGIDSAFTATIASLAVGAERVLGVFMPTKFSSKQSLKDSEELAHNLGIEFKVISIEEMRKFSLKVLEDNIGDTEPNVAEENIQARLRALVLMHLSNKFDHLLLSTGNKSEIAVGYCTLYGDTSGGKNVPGDLYKTELIEISKYINQKKEIIPWNIIERPPTAELKDNQLDTDTLPPYEILDPILREFIENNNSIQTLIDEGWNPKLVKKIGYMVRNNEFKRRQLVHTIKISKKAFGIGRRIPIINKFI